MLLNVLAFRIRPNIVGGKEILDKNQIISLTTKKTLKRISAVSPSVHCFSVLRATERSFIENQEGECFLLPSLSLLCWRLQGKGRMEKKKVFDLTVLPRPVSVDRSVGFVLVGVLMTCPARAQSRAWCVGHCIGLDAKSVREKTEKKSCGFRG